VGLEPTCDQLPFLQGISLRGYERIAIQYVKEHTANLHRVFNNSKPTDVNYS